MLVKWTQGVNFTPTFYEQILHQFPCAKNLQTKTKSKEKLHKMLLLGKSARKMLAKLTRAHRHRVGTSRSVRDRHHLLSSYVNRSKIK